MKKILVFEEREYVRSAIRTAFPNADILVSTRIGDALATLANNSIDLVIAATDINSQVRGDHLARMMRGELKPTKKVNIASDYRDTPVFLLYPADTDIGGKFETLTEDPRTHFFKKTRVAASPINISEIRETANFYLSNAKTV